MTLPSRPNVITSEDTNFQALIQSANLVNQIGVNGFVAITGVNQAVAQIPTLVTAQVTPALLPLGSAIAGALASQVTDPKFISADLAGGNPISPTSADLTTYPGNIFGSRVLTSGARQPVLWNRSLAVWADYGKPGATKDDTDAAKTKADLAFAGLGNTLLSALSASVKGDGVTDDTLAIRGFLATTRATGRSAYFPAGVYLISGAIQYGNQTILGDGAGTVFKNISVNRSGAMFQPASNGVTATLSNFTLDQNSTASDGNSMCVSVQGTVNTVLDHLRFRNIQTMAVWCDSSNAVPTVSPRVEGCIVENSVGGCVSLFGRFTDAQIINCQFNEYSDDAIAMQNSVGGYPVGMVAVGNIFRGGTHRKASGTADPNGSTPHCIIVFGGDNVTISGNVCTGSVASAIAVLPGSTAGTPTGRRPQTVSITGNTVTGAGITTDSTTGVPGAGIEVRGGDGVLVGGNVVNGSRQDGIAVTNSTDVTIAPNSCINNGTTGLAVVSSSDVTVTGGTYSKNGTGGSNQFGVLVDGNSTGVTVTGSTAGDSRATGKTQQYGVFITSGSQVDVNLCRLVGNSAAPISAAVGSTVTQRNNRTTTGRTLATGRATIPANDTGVNVVHNLGGTPARVVLTGYNDPAGLTWSVVDANTATIRRAAGQTYAMLVDYIFDLTT